MAVLLMKLRNVPDDELAEIQDLLEANALEYYQTTAGNWGMSMPALWLVDETRAEAARALLQTYADERLSRARASYEALKASGRARTLRDIARENPLRFVGYFVIIAALLYISLVPFLHLGA